MEIWKFGDSSFAIVCGLISIHIYQKWQQLQSLEMFFLGVHSR